MRAIIILSLLLIANFELISQEKTDYKVSFNINDLKGLNDYAIKKLKKSSTIPILIFLKHAVDDSSNLDFYYKNLDLLFHRNLVKTDSACIAFVPKKIIRLAWKYNQYGKTYENNFDYIDFIIITKLGSIDYNIKLDTLNLAEKYIKKLTGLSLILEKEQDKNYGWFWDVLAQYFIDLREMGYIETFSYLICSNSNDESIKNWISQNEVKISDFKIWNMRYK